MKSRKNLTESNRDYAVFLPSISGFYNTFISGKMTFSDFSNFYIWYFLCNSTIQIFFGCINKIHIFFLTKKN